MWAGVVEMETACGVDCLDIMVETACGLNHQHMVRTAHDQKTADEMIENVTDKCMCPGLGYLQWEGFQAEGLLQKRVPSHDLLCAMYYNK